MARKITVTESDDKTCPQGMRWRSLTRLPVPGCVTGRSRHPDYMVTWDKGRMEIGTSHCATLGQARKEARALVAEGRAWAEVFRWATNGTSAVKVFICSYEVETESGSAVA